MDRQELLLKPHWNNKDICDYVECKKSKAYQIMGIAKTKFNGVVCFNSRCVLRDSVLQVIGTSIERETYILKQIKERRANE